MEEVLLKVLGLISRQSKFKADLKKSLITMSEFMEGTTYLTSNNGGFSQLV
jgi:hypothetical protein